jgi:ATP-binding cassette, subfamily B, bacterial
MADTPAAAGMPTSARTVATLARAMWPFRRRVAVTLLLLLASKLAFVAVPWALKRIVDQFSSPETLAVLPVFALLLYAVLRLLGGIFGELRDLVFARVTQQTIADLMRRVFDHLHRLGARFHIGRQTGGVVRDVERGTTAAGYLLTTSVMTILPTIVEIGAIVIIMAVAYPAAFTVIILGTFIGYSIVTAVLTEKRVKLQRERNELDNSANNRLVDSLLNYETVKAHANEGYESHQLGDVLVKRRDVGLRMQWALSRLHVSQSTVIAIGVAAVMLLAGQRVLEGALTVGDLVLINAYVIQICLPLNTLGFVFREARDALVNSERMFRLLDVPPEIVEAKNVPALVVERGQVQFDSVQFGYDPARQVLWDVSFTIPPGGTVAVVGGSGSGKSTIARLLLRFYDPVGGRITVDGHDIRGVSQQSLRGSIGIVPQDTVLFNDTIAYNIGYSRPGATMADVIAAAQAAHVHEFIMGLPEQYETRVGERGLKLSGGEKQRIAIARAILKDPPILILDEATSALDTRSERAIQSELDRISRDRTTLIIAHRLSTVVDADEIIVLERGHIVERGRHDGLIAQQGVYAQMWALQQKQGDLERTEQKLAVHPINLAAVLAGDVDTLRAELDARRITLFTAIDPDSARVNGDPTVLQQALWELTTHAADLCGPGGRLELRLERSGPQALIVITGARAETPPPVDEDARTPLSPTPPDPLRIRSAIEANKGRFEIKSGRDGVPAYHIELPLRAVSPPAASRTAQPGGDALAGTRLLVVDDDADAREMLSAVLSAFGGEVEQAESTAEVTERLRARADDEWPGLLICDIALRDDDNGYALLHAVRSLEAKRGTPLDRRLPAIALTGFAGVDARVRALLAGFQLHLVKPVESRELVAAAARLAIRRHAAGRE